jgi:carboxyl-terminal processing protease
MLPASNRGVGMNIGFPDVCLTPTPAGPVPIPYPNFALNAQALGFSPTVKVSGVNALNLASKIPMTFGDDAGSAHPVFKQAGGYVMGNPIVSIDRLPAIHLCCSTTGNAMNNALGAVLVPSAVNVLYTYADGDEARDPAGALSAAALAALGEAVRPGAASTSHLLLQEQVGLVRVPIIASDLPSRVRDAWLRLEAAGAEALILDLRGCPGGDLDAAVRLAGDFLDEGDEIVRVEDAEGDERLHYATGPAVYRMPLVLLVDRGTASAAELFAASLRAHGRAIVMGERTYGKGSAQQIAIQGGGGASYATAARVRGPLGIEVEGVGVCPDIALPAAEGAASGEDLWLEAALRQVP